MRNKLPPSLIPVLIVMAGLFIIFSITSSSRNASSTNLALNRVQLCILSKNAATRTQSDIEECYQRIEHKMNVTIERDDRK